MILSWRSYRIYFRVSLWRVLCYNDNMNILDIRAVVFYYTAHPFHDNVYDKTIANFIMDHVDEVSAALSEIEFPTQRYLHPLLISKALADLAKEKGVYLFQVDFSTISHPLLVRLLETQTLDRRQHV